jgi:hypothetical protein
MTLACLCAGRASAQAEIDDARKNARLNLDGLYVTPTFQLKDFGLDSNVFNTPGEQSPDFTFTLAPGAKLALPIARRALVTATVGVDLVYFARYANQRSVNPDVTLRASGFLHRITLFTQAGYVNSRQRLNQEIDARARRTDKNVEAGVEARIVPKLTATLSGSAGRVDYADAQFFRDVSLREALAEDQRSLLASLDYRATPYTTFVLRSEAREDRFLFSSFKDSDSYRVMPGVEFKPRALISGSAYVGFRSLQFLDPEVPNFKGLVANLSLRYTLQSATAFTVTFDRDAEYSYEPLSPYFVTADVGLSIRRQLVGAFDTTLGAQRYHYAYQDLPTVLLGDPRVDITHSYSADIGYRLGRKGRLGVGLSYWTRDSTRASIVAYNGVRIGSTFSYGS